MKIFFGNAHDDKKSLVFLPRVILFNAKGSMYMDAVLNLASLTLFVFYYLKEKDNNV